MSYTLGLEKEQLAADYLVQQGLKLVAKNFHSYLGEIDLIVQEGNTLIFVEVRYRKTKIYGESLETITKPKQRRLFKTAQYYLKLMRLKNVACRFDVVAINGDNTLTWIKHAFIGS